MTDDQSQESQAPADSRESRDFTGELLDHLATIDAHRVAGGYAQLTDDFFEAVAAVGPLVHLLLEDYSATWELVTALQGHVRTMVENTEARAREAVAPRDLLVPDKRIVLPG